MPEISPNASRPADPPQVPRAGEDWQHELIHELATAALVEQRRTRRWSVFFRFAFLVYIVAVPLLYVPWGDLGSGSGDGHTAVVELSGVISATSDASAARITKGLRAAFEDENTKAVVLRINSPGGSPVQSGYIYDEMQRLRSEHPEVPLYAVITDICASGGYYVAAAADRVYADKASVVGSIGVISNGFGFVETMDKLGVERRLIAAGENKGFMDPFSPLKPDEVRHFKAVIGEIHTQFINAVKTGRGDRLSNEVDLFGGLVWTGERAVTLGLVDELGSTRSVARDIVGAEDLVDFSSRRGVLDRLAERVGVSLARALLAEGGWAASLR